MSEAARYQLFTAATPTVTRIIPELAKEIGLNESIMLLQLDYWINHTKNLEGGKWWTYQSVRDMQEKAFPYWSLMTINRTVKSLESKGYITIGNFNERKSDNTRWITLNYKALGNLKSVRVGKVSNESVSEGDTPYQNDTGLYQNDTPAYQNDTTPQQNDTTLPETSKITQESNAPAQKPQDTPLKETPATSNATPPPPIVAASPAPVEFDMERAKFILDASSHIQNFEIDNMKVIPLIRGYERAIGEPFIPSRKQKLDALRAMVAGYTEDEAYELTERKYAAADEDEGYPFAWMISDLPQSRKRAKAAPIQFPIYVPPPQAPPMTRAEMEAIKAQVRAKLAQEDAS